MLEVVLVFTLGSPKALLTESLRSSFCFLITVANVLTLISCALTSCDFVVAGLFVHFPCMSEKYLYWSPQNYLYCSGVLRGALLLSSAVNAATFSAVCSGCKEVCTAGVLFVVTLFESWGCTSDDISVDELPFLFGARLETFERFSSSATDPLEERFLERLLLPGIFLQIVITLNELSGLLKFEND